MMKQVLSDIKIFVSEHRIENGKLHIHVRRHKDGTVTVCNQNKVKEFIFKRSRPEMLKGIAELLIKASELTETKTQEVVLEK